MSMKVGLGACQEDLEIQGEIDFDFFEKEENGVQETSVNKVVDNNSDVEVTSTSSENSQQNNHVSSSTVIKKTDQTSSELSSNPKICFEAVIPLPEDSLQKSNNSIAMDDLKFEVPHLKEEICNDNYIDPLNSPLSSASSSMSDLSSGSSDLTDENDSFDETDSMTDVTPLSSKCHSPMVLQKGDCKNSFKFDQMCVMEESSSLQGNLNKSKSVPQRPFKVNTLMRTLKQLELDQKESTGVVKQTTIPLAESNNSSHRKNPTFTNEEVRKIDQDNQRLLKKIVAQQNRPKPTIIPIYTRPSSSSINRQRQQRQIELDNMALLQRLESAKPSKDLSRLHLLNEYKRRPATCSSLRSMSPSLKSISASCRSSAQKSGRSTTLTIPITGKAAKHR